MKLRWQIDNQEVPQLLETGMTLQAQEVVKDGFLVSGRVLLARRLHPDQFSTMSTERPQLGGTLIGAEQELCAATAGHQPHTQDAAGSIGDPVPQLGQPLSKARTDP